MKEIEYVSPEKRGIIPMKKNEEIEEPQVEEVNLDAFLDSIKETEEYNNNITNHLPSYANFKPLSHVLVRIYRRLPILSKGGFIVDTPTFADWAKVMKQAGSGQDYAVNEAPTSFKFTEEAVIVALPIQQYGGSSELKVGQKICIQQIQTEARKTQDGIVYYNYAGSFVHPSSNKIIVPDSPKDEDYGYALLPMNLIKGIIE